MLGRHPTPAQISELQKQWRFNIIHSIINIQMQAPIHLRRKKRAEQWIPWHSCGLWLQLPSPMKCQVVSASEWLCGLEDSHAGREMATVKCRVTDRATVVHVIPQGQSPSQMGSELIQTWLRCMPGTQGAWSTAFLTLCLPLCMFQKLENRVIHLYYSFPT